MVQKTTTKNRLLFIGLLYILVIHGFSPFNIIILIKDNAVKKYFIYFIFSSIILYMEVVMEETVFKSDDLLVMNLINYFITEKNYNPMIIHGLNDEIWLENLDSSYKIVRIVSHHIHNKEQLDFDKFKLSRIVKQVKKKTLSFNVKVLNIYMDIEDDKLLSDNDVYISKEEDINNSKLTNVFPDIVEKTERKRRWT